MLIERAATALSQAKSAAEVLEACDMASVAYDAAKKAGRLAKAKQAHDELVSAARRAQGDALLIEAQAKQRLADEYDAAQECGDVARLGTNQKELGILEEKTRPATVGEIGLTHKQVHEARLVRDAEIAQPGIVQRVVDDAIAAGEEPTKANVRKAAVAVVSAAKPEVTTPIGHPVQRLSGKDLKRLFKDRPAFSEVQDMLRHVYFLAGCFDCAGYEDEIPENDRVTPGAFWEYISAIGENQQETREELQTAFDTLEAILAAAPTTSRAPRPKKLKAKRAVGGLSVIEQASAFHYELVHFIADYCTNVEAWRANNADLCDEAFHCIYNALETSSVRLGRMAQELDGR
ncbi:hypothetical protein EAS61_34070 [Bradyrhizobium zhanjiangense]|uniref:Uncharacterized protein n=2 Tax=Bradyrhizobium zhanjiangense TaxID=1325107 RepID=A0A4Q0QBJ3_9BRAD|nr:hypothetical protein EAS61_34070 [Bradyrhizobium zhanjiangense]